MSCDAHEKFCEYIEEMAYRDLVIANDREPTEDELNETIECLMEKWI
jgi:hypothetical protein